MQKVLRELDGRRL